MTDDTRGRLELAELGLARLKTDRERLDRIDRYARGDHDRPYTPTTASEEYKLLAARAVSNWCQLLVKAPSQALAVSGYRRQGGSDVEWSTWRRERLPARQKAVHRAALTYGQAFVTVLPDPTDRNRARVRGVSPRLMHVSYGDPSADAWPLWALQVEAVPESPTETARAWFYDDVAVTELEVTGKGTARVVNVDPHGMGVCPVVRFAPDIDLEGRVTGVVEPMIPIQDRVNQTVFDLLVAQTFGSFKVRTISGMAPDFKRDVETGEILLDANGRPIPIPIQADASRFLVAPDADTKFGVLDETPLTGFLAAVEAGVRTIAAVSQTPPHYLLGSLVNLSAEALAAAESALTRFVSEVKQCFGESWEQVLGLAAVVAGETADPGAEVLWADAESRSLSQTVDALGKAVTMLQVPPRAMWPRIPGATAQDVEAWAQIAEADDPGVKLADRMARVVAS